MWNLFKTRADAKHQEETTLNSRPNYLSHPDEPVDFYRTYEDDGFAPKNGKNHPRSVFDDLDIKDKPWFTLAKRYLRDD